MPRWLKITGIGCGGLLGLLVLMIGCAAIIGTNQETSTQDKAGQAPPAEEANSEEPAVEEPAVEPEPEEEAAEIGETVEVGDVAWTVTNTRQANQLTQQGVPSEFAKTEQGNFVIVDFDFTNNGDEAVTLDNESLALVDSEGRESGPSPDAIFYVPEERQIFLERVNPGVTQQGQAIFEVAPGASGFQLQAGDARMFTNENAYIDLGF